MEQDVHEVENSCLYFCAVTKIIVVERIRKNTSKRFQNVWSKQARLVLDLRLYTASWTIKVPKRTEVAFWGLLLGVSAR
jgi:hypothetical protein